MAHESPSSIDVQDIQFKLHDKLQIVGGSKQELTSNVSLLTAASSKGLLFAGDSNAAELKVFMLKELVDSKEMNIRARVRTIPLPNVANIVACSADGSMLAVCLMPMNGSALLQIYSVASFTTPNVVPFYNFRLSPEEHVYAVQLLWNPVLVGNFAVILSNGSLAMYTLKGDGTFEMHTLDKSLEVKCGCWSPKGKQIVLGFPNGKLQQFKPDLTPAKTIVCPVGVHPGPFSTIALHWLSTFQFAAVFLQNGADTSPSLYIVNAPKGGTPTYINYYDICYSGSGPRMHQVTFTHIQQWNLLLMTSANGVEVGILGTRDAGEMPTWHQYTLLDEARIEMPLTESKDETYPMGFAFDNSSSHQLVIGEKVLPVMPMVYVLSTHGHLISFNFLNLTPGAVDVCSPPPPVMDMSGQFAPLPEYKNEQAAVAGTQEQPSHAVGGLGAEGAFSFAANPVTSTPAMKDKAAPMFGNVAAAAPAGQPASIAPFGGGGTMPQLSFGGTKPPTSTTFGMTLTGGQPETGSTFGVATSIAPSLSGFAAIGSFESTPPFSGFGAKLPAETAAVKPQAQATQQQPQQPPQIKPQTVQNQQPLQSATTLGGNQKLSDLNKPLYSVPGTFNPSPAATTQSAASAPVAAATAMPTAVAANLKPQLSSSEIDESVKQMIAVQIAGFELEMRQLANQSKGLLGNLGNLDELKAYTKRLNDLQEINEQAKDRDFEMDVQNLQHSLNEIYAMQTECRSKLEMHNNPDITRLASMSTYDPINRRQLNTLRSYVSTNSVQLQQLQQLVDAQWSNYQDLVRRNSRSKMHIPCLDGIYQRMSKFKDLLSSQRVKLNYIKAQLNQKGLVGKPLDDIDDATEHISNGNSKNALGSLVDSMLSMSLSQTVETKNSRLSAQKLDAIRNCIKDHQQITIIKPLRPNRVGINSEVILESKLRNDRKVRENMVKATEAKLQQANQRAQQQAELKDKQIAANASPLQATLAKPTATKPPMSAGQPLNTFAAPPVLAPPATSTFNFGNTSRFVKTSTPFTAPAKTDEQIKPFAPASTAPSAVDFSSNASHMFAMGGQMKSQGATNPVLKEALTTPISFSAKVISGDATGNTASTAKPSPIATSAAATAAQGFTTLVPNANGMPAPTFAIKTPTAAAAATADKENVKTTEATTKPFTFGQSADGAPPPAVLNFGGAKPLSGFGTAAANTSATKGSLFDGKVGAASTGGGGGGGGGFSFTGFGNALSAPTSIATSTTATSAAPTLTGFTVGGAGAATKSTTSSIFAGAPKLLPEATATEATATTPSTKSIFAAPAKLGGDATSAVPPTTTSSFATYTFNNGTWNLRSPETISLGTEAAGTALPSGEKNATAGTATDDDDKAAVTSKPDATDSLFGNLNICKPTAATAAPNENATAAGKGTTAAPNLFSGFGGSSIGSTGGAFSFTSALNSSGSGSDASKPFGMGANAFSFTGAAGAFAQPPPATAASDSASTAAATTTTNGATAATPAAPAAATTTKSIFATGVSSTTTTTTTNAPAAAPSLPAFGSLSMSTVSAAATTTATTPSAAPAPAAPSTGSIFGGTASFLITPASTGAATTTTTTSTAGSIFSGAAAAPPTASSIFAAAAAATPAPGSDIFGSTPAATATTPVGGNIFGGVAGLPKPEHSVFGGAAPTAGAVSPVAGAGTGLFAAAAAANPSPFSSSTATGAGSGGSIFGGSGIAPVAFGGANNTAASIFGGGGATAATNTFGVPAAADPSATGNIFGGGAKPAESPNVFGSPTQPGAAGGGSIFGQSSFGQPAGQTTGGNLFGGAAATAQQPAATAFGGGSIFGGSTASNTSVFGGNGGNNPVGFGSFSQVNTSAPFGSPPPGTGGSFAQAGSPSIAQTGFGSPSQPGSAFGKPMFGGFNSPTPAFGAQPSFGGAPTFGSPKGFGSFTNVAAPATSPTAFGNATQKSNLFETLGSSESSLSFGNLAQGNNPNAAKPSFGGSSFMNYRA